MIQKCGRSEAYASDLHGNLLHLAALGPLRVFGRPPRLAANDADLARFPHGVRHDTAQALGGQDP